MQRLRILSVSYFAVHDRSLPSHFSKVTYWIPDTDWYLNDELAVVVFIKLYYGIY